MLYTVEVRLAGSDLVASMGRMRTWLDHKGYAPESFRHRSGERGIVYRLEFSRQGEADDFAQAFGGDLSHDRD